MFSLFQNSVWQKILGGQILAAINDKAVFQTCRFLSLFHLLISFARAAPAPTSFFYSEESD
jgi:hypothetical protein